MLGQHNRSHTNRLLVGYFPQIFSRQSDIRIMGMQPLLAAMVNAKTLGRAKTIGRRLGAGANNASHGIYGKHNKGDIVAYFRIITTILAAVAVSGVTEALAESGTNGERNSVISRYKAFEVIKQSGKGSCYAKAYGNSTGKMELNFDGTSPIIVARFDRGLAGDMQYWVDNGPRHTVSASTTRGANTFVLAADVVGPMKAGRTLYVRMTPVGNSSRIQKFSLMGFTAATRVLASPECRHNKNASPPPNLEVKLTRNSGGGVVVSGRTILPDGMNLLISLQTDVNGYYAQDTARVHSGLYESGEFTDRGHPLPSGGYTVSISSPLMYLQPLRVQSELGASGDEIPKNIRQRSPYADSYIVDYSVSRSLD